MKHILNTSLKTTAEHLAFEEAYLTGLDQGIFRDPLLYFWEVNSTDIVLGASNKVNEEVIDKKDTIFRRCSGGGTIVQGPGCLNYAFIMPISYKKVRLLLVFLRGYCLKSRRVFLIFDSRVLLEDVLVFY